MALRFPLRRDVVAFLSACGLSQFGRSITLILLPLMMLKVSGSASLTALVTAIEAVPTLLLGLIAGALADRGRIRRLLVVSDFACACASFIAAALALHDGLRPAAIFAVATVAAIAVVFRDAATFGALRRLADGRLVTELASATQTTGAGAAIVGPIVAGWFVASNHPAWGLATDATCCAAAAILYAAGVGSASTTTSQDPGGSEPLTTALATGLRTLFSIRALRHLTVVAALGSVSAGAVMALISPFVIAQSATGRPATTAGIVIAGGSVGGLLGAALMPGIIRRLETGRVVVATVGLVGVLAAMLPEFHNAVALTIGYGLWQFAFALLVTSVIATRLTVTPSDVIARVAMTGRMIGWGAQPVGAVIAAGLASRLGPGAAIQLVSVVAVSAAVGALLARTASVLSLPKQAATVDDRG